MALLLHEHIQPEGALGLWRIEEPEAWFLTQLDLAPSELQQLERLRGRRRAEWLAARQLVHQMSGRTERAIFWKDEYGKPHLRDSVYDISISHSHGLAAAIAAPKAVGIDIQKIVPKLERLAAKYMRPVEIESLAEGKDRLPQLHVFWGAKEALYKAYGRRALDFRKHIHISSFHYQQEGGAIAGCIEKDGLQLRFQLQYQCQEEHMLVYAMEAQGE
ncbi:MAG: 4'-phosphopantetheinyl transferase superfamily protein [Bacteroidetes bacterium]|jgi:phosphopantetheinyl transferase|nr:4'-phosphopantetheinyl transferase superfamily protein [Bacteroidota bacterium]